MASVLCFKKGGHWNNYIKTCNDTVHAKVDNRWCCILEIGERKKKLIKEHWLLTDGDTILKMGKMIRKTYKNYDSGWKTKTFCNWRCDGSKRWKYFLKLFVYVFFRIYIFDTDDMCTYCFKCKSKKDI